MNIYYVAAIWLGMALIASIVSIKIAVPAALAEIVVGALAGNIPGLREHITQPDFVVFLASVGSLVLTFLAGAEIDPVSLRGHWRASVSIGLVSFALPFLAAFGFCGLVLGWNLHAAEIGGIALSTTSVAVVYAVLARVAWHRSNTAAAQQALVAAQRVRPLLTYAQPHLAVQARIELAKASHEFSGLPESPGQSVACGGNSQRRRVVGLRPE